MADQNQDSGASERSLLSVEDLERLFRVARDRDLAIAQRLIESSTHLRASRLPDLAQRPSDATPDELRHMEECERCRRMLARWVAAYEGAVSGDSSDGAAVVAPEAGGVSRSGRGLRPFLAAAGALAAIGVTFLVVKSTTSVSGPASVGIVAAVDSADAVGKLACREIETQMQGAGGKVMTHVFEVSGEASGFVYFLAVRGDQLEVLPHKLNLSEEQRVYVRGSELPVWCVWSDQPLDTKRLSSLLKSADFGRLRGQEELMEWGRSNLGVEVRIFAVRVLSDVGQ